MKVPAVATARDQRSYWHERVRAEAKAALACDDPRIAAIHVELATRCLKMASASMPVTVNGELEPLPQL